MPPITTIAKIIAQQTSSQTATRRPLGSAPAKGRPVETEMIDTLFVRLPGCRRLPWRGAADKRR